MSAAPVDVLSSPLSGFVSAISAAFSASRHVVGQNIRAATHTLKLRVCVCALGRPQCRLFLISSLGRGYSPFFSVTKERSWGGGGRNAMPSDETKRCAQVSFSPEQRCSLCVVTIAPPHNNTKSFFLKYKEGVSKKVRLSTTRLVTDEPFI